MLKIRLERVGRVHEPSFRLVLTDSKSSSKTGRFKEILGSYDPRKSTDSLDAERIKHWLSSGATPTDTVHNLLVKHRVITGKKINVSAKSKKAPILKEEVVVEPPASDVVGTESDSGVTKSEEDSGEAKEELSPEVPEAVETPEKEIPVEDVKEEDATIEAVS